MRADKIIAGVVRVTKKWTKQRKREEREKSAELNRRQAMTAHRHVSIKEAAWEVMEEAYRRASNNGKLPAHARQIMYAARPLVQEITGRELEDAYFTQQLLPEYVDDYGVDWDIAYDSRGHLAEPFTEEEIPLGTLDVRDYLSRVEGHDVPDLDFSIWEDRYPTLGPRWRYSAILFIEKEGFWPLFKAVKLAERYDIAIMSTKGMSVTAARELVDGICQKHRVPLLTLHDFDQYGFRILGTLHQSTLRYQFSTKLKPIDLGLRLADIEGLQSERVHIARNEKTQRNLRGHGATEEEIAYLLQGRRVELNAMTSDQLVAFIERKLDENKIKKVLPDRATIADAYRRMRRQAEVQAIIDKAVADMEDEKMSVPRDTRAKIAAQLEADPSISWDAALRTIVEEENGNEDSSPPNAHLRRKASA